jgi:hypothetical protein
VRARVEWRLSLALASCDRLGNRARDYTRPKAATRGRGPAYFGRESHPRSQRRDERLHPPWGLTSGMPSGQYLTQGEFSRPMQLFIASRANGPLTQIQPFANRGSAQQILLQPREAPTWLAATLQ